MLNALGSKKLRYRNRWTGDKNMNLHHKGRFAGSLLVEAFPSLAEALNKGILLGDSQKRAYLYCLGSKKAIERMKF